MGLVAALVLLICVLGCNAEEDGKETLRAEKRLYNDLLARNNPNILPVLNASSVMLVKIGLALINIIDVNEKENLINTQMWLRLLWQDIDLKWDPINYDGVTTLRGMPINKIWRPDIALYNAAQDGVTHFQETLAVIYSSGDVLWIPPAIVKSTCHFDMTYFPFDTQHCNLKFGSWTYGSQIDMDLYEGAKRIDLSDYEGHNEWVVIDTKAAREIMFYPCCPGVPYVSVDFNLTIARVNSVFSVMSVTPYIFLAILCPIIFLFPYGESQRFSLGGSILICLVLLMTAFEGVIPPSTGQLPLIAQYYIGILILLALNLIFSALILNLADRRKTQSSPPKILKRIVVDFLGRVLCVPKDNYESFSESEGTSQNEDGRKPQSGKAEWRIMAQTLDRLCFIIYVLLTFILTVAFFARKNKYASANQGDIISRIHSRN